MLISDEVDCARFERAIAGSSGAESIGTKNERSFHAVMKRYIEPDETLHEVKVGRYVADVALPDPETGEIAEIAEVQTHSLYTLKAKLDHFTVHSRVTIVYPLPSLRWLTWVDPETGEAVSRRKVGRIGTPASALRELYPLREYLGRGNPSVLVALAEVEDFKRLDGRGKDRKIRSTRTDRVPTRLERLILLREASDYTALLPEGLPERFTTEDIAKMGRIDLQSARSGAKLLSDLGCIASVGKRGNTLVYELNVK